MDNKRTNSKTDGHVEVLYSEETERQMIAARNQAANRKRKMLAQSQVPLYLESRLQALYKKSRIEGALTQYEVETHLAKYAKASGEVIGERSPNIQRRLVEKFKHTTNGILTDISGDVRLSKTKTAEYRDEIEKKADGLNTVDMGKRFEIVQEIGVTLTEAAIKSEKKLHVKDLAPPKKRLSKAEAMAILRQRIIPLGFDSEATRITVGEFLRFPLNISPPDEGNWFAVHRKYLEELSKQNRISSSEHDLTVSVIPFVPMVRYQKYFDIFPKGEYQDSVLMAVFSLFQNRAFDRMRIEP